VNDLIFDMNEALLDFEGLSASSQEAFRECAPGVAGGSGRVNWTLRLPVAGSPLSTPASTGEKSFATVSPVNGACCPVDIGVRAVKAGAASSCGEPPFQ
jgi:hypothetical protein